MKLFQKNNQLKVSRIAIVIIFLAIIRNIVEVIRLYYHSTTSFTYVMIEPYLIAALVSSVLCLIMTILSFYAKHLLVIVISVFTILVLLYIKFSYWI